MRLLRSIWYVLTLRCDEAERVRTALPREQLDWHEALGERIHSALCSSCRRARRQIEAMHRAIEDMRRSHAPGPGLSDDARARIAAMLERTARETD